MFLLFGPLLLAVIGACGSIIAVTAGCYGCVAGAVMFWIFVLIPHAIVIAVLFGLAVSAVAGLLDGLLARTMPLRLRALLIAISGAVIVAIPFRGSAGSILIPFAISGAISMGACSLLSHELTRRIASQQRPCPERQWF
jgi:hypothetical protein